MAGAILATLLPVLGSAAAALVPKLIDLAFKKKDTTTSTGKARVEETMGSLIAKEATKAGISLSKDAIAKIVKDLNKVPAETGALGAPCNEHKDCSQTGYEDGDSAGLFTAVGCCKDPAHDYKTCQFKKRDWAGVNYCPAECVGKPFGGHGTCTRSSESREEALYNIKKESNAAQLLRQINDIDRPVPKYLMHKDSLSVPSPMLGSIQPDIQETRLDVNQSIKKIEEPEVRGHIPLQPSIKHPHATETSFNREENSNLGISGSIRNNLSKMIDLGTNNIRRKSRVEIINPLVKEERHQIIKV